MHRPILMRTLIKCENGADSSAPLSFRSLKVLVACEESQVVCSAFRLLGHEAYSCDIVDCSGSHPEWHLKQDVIPLLSLSWDLIIAHPPCTYLSKAGANRMYSSPGVVNSDRLALALDAKDFFMKFYNCSCEHVAIENPTPLKIVHLPEPSQSLNPFEFGDPYSKRTLLWLKNLPPLFPTGIYVDYLPWVNSSRGNSVFGVACSKKDRSRTFSGIAAAMADQWSRYILDHT